MISNLMFESDDAGHDDPAFMMERISETQDSSENMTYATAKTCAASLSMNHHVDDH